MIHDYFTEFRDLIEERCGIHFDDTQRPSLSASLTSRMQQLGLADAREYYDRLRGQAPSIEVEFRHLINLVTVTETSFFRDPSQFLLLRHHIVPTLLAERAADRDHPRTLRIWSAGCSSGEEAYSIAITLSEMGVSLAYPDWTFEIVGTDLNTEVLAVARRGVYSPRAVRNVEGSLLARCFRPEGNAFALSDDIKRCVRFEEGNLTQFPLRCPHGELQDIVFCKNVAIYFRPDATRQLVRGLRDAITEGGYLLVGHSESLWQMSDGFSLVEHNRAYCYRKDRRSSIVDRRSASVDRPASIGDRPASTASAIDSRPSTLAVGPGFSRAEGSAGLKASPTPADGLGTPVGPGFSPAAIDTDQYARSLAAFRAGDWTAAEASLRGLIQACETFVPAHLLLGGVYAHSGRHDEAIAQAECVLRLDDLEPRAHLLLGMIAARRQQLDEAFKSLRRALYLDESLALAHFWLANLHRDRGDVVRACHEYQNVVLDWERHTFELTEEFASDLSAEQLVEFCSDSLQRLGGPALCR